MWCVYHCVCACVCAHAPRVEVDEGGGGLGSGPHERCLRLALGQHLTAAIPPRTLIIAEVCTPDTTIPGVWCVRLAATLLG